MGLDIVELVIDLESAFGISISEAALAEARTVGDLYDLLVARLAGDVNRPAVGEYSGRTWERYLDIVERSTDTERKHLRSDAEFIRDLGLG